MYSIDAGLGQRFIAADAGCTAVDYFRSLSVRGYGIFDENIDLPAERHPSIIL